MPLKLPKEIKIYIEEDGQGDEFLSIAYEDTDVPDGAEVGTYKLEKKGLMKVTHEIV